MKRTLLLTVASIALIASTRLPASPSEQSAEVLHQPLGGASTAPAVVIRGFSPGRLAGVSSDVAGARHWGANIRGIPTSLDFGTTITVTGGTETGSISALSSMEIRELQLPATSRSTGGEQDRFKLAFTPKVQSASYRLEIWNGSTRVFEVSGLRTGGVVLAGNDPICDAIGKVRSVALGICYFTIGTCSSLDDEGRFNWTIHRVAPVPWIIPAVSQEAVVGDQMRIVEEARRVDHVMFRNVAIQGLNLSEMLLMDELATTTAPAGHRPGH